MISSPRIDHDLIRKVREIRARKGWTHPLETVNGRALRDGLSRSASSQSSLSRPFGLQSLTQGEAL